MIILALKCCLLYLSQVVKHVIGISNFIYYYYTLKENNEKNSLSSKSYSKKLNGL